MNDIWWRQDDRISGSEGRIRAKLPEQLAELGEGVWSHLGTHGIKILVPLTLPRWPLVLTQGDSFLTFIFPLCRLGELHACV